MIVVCCCLLIARAPVLVLTCGWCAGFSSIASSWLLSECCCLLEGCWSPVIRRLRYSSHASAAAFAAKAAGRLLECLRYGCFLVCAHTIMLVLLSSFLLLLVLSSSVSLLLDVVRSFVHVWALGRVDY